MSLVAHRMTYPTDIRLRSMDPYLYADQAIREALAEGTLDPLAHAGKPLPNMRPNDDGWWIRSFLDREELPARYDRARLLAGDLLDRAVAAPELDQARAILAHRNSGVRAWNKAEPETHRLAVVEEPQLVALRHNLR